MLSSRLALVVAVLCAAACSNPDRSSAGPPPSRAPATAKMADTTAPPQAPVAEVPATPSPPPAPPYDLAADRDRRAKRAKEELGPAPR